MNDYDILIVGGGAAGLSVASGAAQLGAKAALVSDEALGGDCLYYGCVPSKTLIKSAKVAHMMRCADRFGLDPQEPRFDFGKILGRVHSTIDAVSVHDDPERFQKMGVEVIQGSARFRDAHTMNITTSKGEPLRISANKIVLATGSRTFVPPIPGLKEAGYITHRDVFDLKHQPSSLVIIGGGAIGCEMAQAFARLGTKVTILQHGPQILSREDPSLVEFIENTFHEEGIQIVTKMEVLDVSMEDGQKVLRYERSDKVHTRKVDEILIATGRRPNLESLNLDKVGIKYNKRGIQTDERLRTNLKHVYAIGDVNGKSLFTHTAGYEAGIVVRNAVLKLPSKVNYDRIPRTTFTDPELAAYGITEDIAKERGITYEVWCHSFELQDRALTEGENRGMVKLVTSGRRGKLIGAQIVGPHAGELLHECIIAINAGLTVGHIAGAVHVYPTLADAVRATAAEFYRKKFFTPWTRKWLKRIFRYRGKVELET